MISTLWLDTLSKHGQHMTNEVYAADADKVKENYIDEDDAMQAMTSILNPYRCCVTVFYLVD